MIRGPVEPRSASSASSSAAFQQQALCITHIEVKIGDLKDRGEFGESEYGEKADITLLLGDGNNGDFNAIIMAERNHEEQRIESQVSGAVP